MEKIEFTTSRFLSKDEQASEVRTWSGRYSNVVSKLGELGSEVRISRTLESDQDIAPYSFVRGAVHEFVFPPQQITVSEDNSRVIHSTPGYGLRREEVTRTYDEAQVAGHLEVRYDDADSRIAFSITDLRGESELSEEVLAVLAQSESVSPRP